MTFTIGVVGAGAMGRGVAQIFAGAGNRVLMCDVREGAAQEAHAFVTGMYERAAQKGRMSADEARAAACALEVAADLKALSDCDLVIEAIIEDLEAKRELFRQLEEIVRGDAILATNTSSLSVTAIAAGCARPDRVAGYHFFNPAPLMKVVEVIPGARTAAEIVDQLCALAEKAGHRPVVATDTPGFIVNHAGRGLTTEALRILHENVAGVEVIDQVLKDAAGFRMGPFELMDLTGLDVSGPVMNQVYAQYYHEPRFRPTPLIAQNLAAGLLGRKTGEGFYRYGGGGERVCSETPLLDDPARFEDASGVIWVSDARPEFGAHVRTALEAAGVEVERGARPSPHAVAVVTPLGMDASRTCVEESLDPAQVVAVDMLNGLGERRTLMATPATAPTVLGRAGAAFAAGGHRVSLINDSTGFITQRVLAMIINIACDMAQQRVASVQDIDAAVRLGLGYPRGPLEWGDQIGSKLVLEILQNIHSLSGDPRYRPSPWLRRRAELELSLLHES